jgi:hypothetical protein
VRRALWWLLWRQWVGPLRSLARKPLDSRGIAVLLMLVFLVAVLAFPRSPDASGMFEQITDDDVRFWAPWALLGLTLLGVLAPRGIHFRPPDVAFLFPAPVTPRELVLYNVLLSARASLLSAVWLSLLRGWRGLGAFAGIVLTLLFLQLATQCISALRAWLALPSSTLARRALWIGLGVAVLSGAAANASGIVFSELPLAWRQAPAQITRPFIEGIMADSWTRSAPWLGIALAELSLLAALTCALGARVHESSLSASLRAQEIRARRRAGGFFAISRPRAGVRLPRFPRLAGAGPVAWRQSMGLVRNPGGAALYLGILALPLVVISGLQPSFGLTENPEISQRLFSSTLLMTFVFLSIVMSGNLTFDFRIDVDRMPLLKSLPISSLALAVGQTLPVAVFTTVIQWIGMLVMLAVLDVPIRSVALLLLVLPAANWAAISVENAIFLLFPYRTVPEDPGDVGFAGRVLAVMMAKLCVLGLLATMAGGLGWAAFFLTDSRVAAATVAAGVLAGACALVLWVVAWAFQRFDVAADVPG